ncbi:unnamed protein product, partial [Tetraodon nigroviridis]
RPCRVMILGQPPQRPRPSSPTLQRPRAEDAHRGRRAVHARHHRSPPAWNEELLLSCGFLLCKGLVGPLDLVSVHLASQQRLFSFLSLAWGFVADVDIESEKYRHVGAIRFLMGTLVRLATLRVYQGRLAYLPVKEAPPYPKGSAKAVRASATPQRSSLCSSLPCQLLATESPNQNVWDQRTSATSNHNTTANCSNNAITAQRAANRGRPPPDSLLPGLDQPLPDGWTLVKEEDFVLVLAIYQSHLAEDLWAAPGATADDGVIHLFYVTAGISRPALLRLFLAMEKGAHLACGCPHLVYEKVRALRLEPVSPQGVDHRGRGGGGVRAGGGPDPPGTGQAGVRMTPDRRRRWTSAATPLQMLFSEVPKMFSSPLQISIFLLKPPNLLFSARSACRVEAATVAAAAAGWSQLRARGRGRVCAKDRFSHAF